MEEQHKILSYIVAETAPIESSIHSLNREIRLLRDYRTRLISDLVTGKLDVREAAANLPDEAPPEISEPDIDLTDESEAEEAVA